MIKANCQEEENLKVRKQHSFIIKTLCQTNMKAQKLQTAYNKLK